MISSPVHDLTVRIPNGEPISLVREVPGRAFQFETESDGATFGFAEPVVVTVESDLTDGTRGQIVRHENREASFRVSVVAENSIGLAEGEALLRSLIGGPAEAAWTPPDGWGATTVFEVLWSQMQWQFDDMDELRIRRVWQVTFTAKPFGRSVDATVTAALGGGEVPTVVEIDDASSTTNWTGSIGGTAETVQDAGDSVSIEATTSRTNLIINPSAEVDTAGWTVGSSGSTLSRTATGATSGSWAFAINPAASTLLCRMTTSALIPIDPTLPWSFAADMRRVGTGTITGTLRIQWYTAAGAADGFHGLSVNLTTTSTRYALQLHHLDVPDTAAFGRPWIEVDSSNSSTYVVADSLQFEQSETATAYFDGDSSVAGSLGYRWTGTPNLSTSIEVPVGPTELTRAGLTEDFTDTPYLIADFATSAGDSASVAAEVVTTSSGTVALTRDSVNDVGGGRHRAIFDCTHTDVEEVRILVGDATDGAPTLLDVDHIERSSTNALTAATARQLFRSIEVGGSADTQGSLSISHETDALGDVLVYTSRDDGSNYQPPLRPWRVDGGTVTPDSDRVSGATSPLDSATAETYEIPVSALVSGKHDLVAYLAAAAAGDKTINWTASTRYDSTDLGTVSGSTVVTLTTGYTSHPIASIELPPISTPTGSTAVVRITLSSLDAVTIDEAWVFNLDIGALTEVACGTSTPAAGGSSNRLWIDTETLENSAKVERGTLENRSDAHNAGADVSSMGAHEFAPGTVKAFTVTSNALNAAVSLEHYERWGDNAIR